MHLKKRASRLFCIFIFHLGMLWQIKSENEAEEECREPRSVGERVGAHWHSRQAGNVPSPRFARSPRVFA